MPASAMHRREGWAMVQMNTNGSLKQARYGPVPREACPEQLARDAEDSRWANWTQNQSAHGLCGNMWKSQERSTGEGS
eukprot:2472339-Amphidinium_carterae.1